MVPFLHRLLLEAPGCYLAWPAGAMLLGTLGARLAGRSINHLALVPRRAAGLVGLATAPFIHVNFAHLAANLPPFLVLGALVLHRGGAHFAAVTVAIALLQGALLWLLGRSVAHVGMSGVIFGFFGYLLGAAWFRPTSADLIVAGAAMLFYGGMLAGVKPARNGTSWEGHLFGLVAGFAVAWLELRL